MRTFDVTNPVYLKALEELSRKTYTKEEEDIIASSFLKLQDELNKTIGTGNVN